ncbi:hypothetical protein Tco_0810333 [Tanacetum coccineum]
MRQQQHAADVHPDELCPPNKRYDLMDANKKVDLEHVQCPSECKFCEYHQEFFLITTSALQLFNRYHKELTLTLDDFRTIFHLPQATDNNHNSFVPPPLFSYMVPFDKQVLGFTSGSETSSCFKTMVFCAYGSNVIRARDMYHNLQDDDIMKNIFNSGRHKNKVGMQIPAWMITEEMKHTEHYRMYAEVFGIDVPLTQSQPTESTQGTHRTTSAPRSPNPNKEAESSAPRRSTVIRLRIPERRSTRLTPPAPVPNVDKADEIILQDTLQVSLAEHKSREEQEARENVALVDEHLASEEIEKMVDGQENVVDDSSIPRNDESNILGTRIEPRSNKESPEVEITKDKEVEITKETLVVDITNVVIPVNVNDEDEEITDEVYELKRREKGKIVEETRNSPIPTPIRSPRIHTNLVSSDTEKLQELTDTHTTSSSSSPHKKLAKTNRLLSLFKTKPTRFTLQELLSGVTGTLWLLVCTSTCEEQVMKQVPEQVRNQVPVYVSKGLILKRQKAKEEMERLTAKAILQERGNIQAQISTQIENAIANVIPSQVDASVGSYMSGHILHVHPAQSQTSSVPDQQYQLYLCYEVISSIAKKQIHSNYGWNLQRKFELKYRVLQTTCITPAVRPRDQDDPHDDAHPEGENSAKRQKTSEYEAYLRKVADEMLRQRCTSGDEHQYHIDQMKNFLKSDIVWESIKEILKGNSGPEKIVLSLHKFPAIIFNNDDIEERTSRWVNKCVKKFNPYARYGVEHWKNPHAKIFYIRKQKEPGKPKEEIYSNSKIVQVIKTYWESGTGYAVHDCYGLYRFQLEVKVIWERVHDFQLGIESYQQKVNLTAPIMTFPGIEDHEMFSIIYEPVYGIIYKNSKKEKRVMRHSEIYKFCDAMLNRVLEGLKSYNNDIKYGYVQKDLTNDEVAYLKLFEERLKHHKRDLTGGNLFEVRSGSEGFTVDEGKRTCSCRTCMYSIVMPPKPRKMLGRPRKKRIRSIGEGGSSTRVSKVGSQASFSNCKKPRHNKASCKEPILEQIPKPKGVPGRPRKNQSNVNIEDDDVVLRGPLRDEGAGGSRGGASRSKRKAVGGSRGGVSGSRGGASGSRGGASGSKRKVVSSAGTQKKTG